MGWHKRRLFTWQQLDSGSARQASGKFHLPKIPLHVEGISWYQTITYLQFPMKYNIGINKYTMSSSLCVFTMKNWPHGSNVILGYLKQCFYSVGCNDTVLCYRHIEFCDILQTVALLETCIDSLLPLMYGIYKLLGIACLWDVLRHKTLKHSQLSSVALYHQNTINSIFTMAPSYTLGSFNWYKFRHKRLCIAYGRLNSVLQDCSFA